MTTLSLDASSRADEAGILAMRDLAAVGDLLDVEYRVIGGQMVRLHVALAGVAEPVVRVTLDADMGVTAASAAHPGLIPALEVLGYTRPGAAAASCGSPTVGSVWSSTCLHRRGAGR